MNPPKTDSEYQAERMAMDFAIIALNGMNFDTSLESVRTEDIPRLAYDICHSGKVTLESLFRAKDEKDENDALKTELASLKTVAKAAHKGQSDFKNYYPERGYSTDASDYNPRAERLKKNIRDLDEALTNHTAKYKLE